MSSAPNVQHLYIDVPHRTHPGYELSPQRGFWSVILPEATTNLIVNPSVELAAWTTQGTPGTIERIATWQQAGLSSMHVVTPKAGDGCVIQATIGVAAGQIYTASCYVKVVSGAAQLLLVDSATKTVQKGPPAVAVTGYEGRLVMTTAATASENWALLIVSTNAAEFYADAAQIEQKPYATTYCDGDQRFVPNMPNNTDFQWTGARNASTSTRSSQTRLGGRVVNVQDLGFQVMDYIGAGMEPVSNITTPLGRQGGTMFQTTIAGARALVLVGMIYAMTFPQLQRTQAALQNAFRPDSVAARQPLVLRYQAADACGNAAGPELDILCTYDGGLEGDVHTLDREKVTIRFTAPQPHFTTVGAVAKSLAIKETITDANYIVERQTNGTFRALGGGLSGAAYSAVYSPYDGMLYVGGAFLTAYNGPSSTSPVTVNHIARWDGAAWAALGSGFNAAVRALAFDGNGNLYAGGDFTDASYPYLAMWNGSVWAGLPGVSATAGSGSVYALAFSPRSNALYIGGAFTTWAGVAGSNYLVSYTISTPAYLSAPGTDGAVFAIRPWSNGDVYIGGAFATLAGTAASSIGWWQYATSSYKALGSGANDVVRAIAISPGGGIYIGGQFAVPGPYIAVWNGAWTKLSSGVNDWVYALSFPPAGPYTGLLGVGGTFTAAGGLTVADSIANWNGSAWSSVPIDLPGSPATITTIAHHPDGQRVALGYTTAGTATVSNISDTVVTNGGTAEVAPKIAIFGPGTLESIQNWTTGKTIFFNLSLGAAEYAILDLTPGQVWFGSNLRGNILSALLPGSDQGTFRLLPGDNTILVKMSGATSANSRIQLLWRKRYHSVEGATY